MGYTHYFSKNRDSSIGEFTTDEMNSLASYVKKIIEASNVRIKGPDGKGKPIFSDSEISFNGSLKRDEDFESFCISINDSDHRGFCKTGRRPYDEVVVATLVAAKKVFGDKINCGSDAADSYELENGFHIYQKACGYDAGNPNWQDDIEMFLNDCGISYDYEDDDDDE